MCILTGLQRINKFAILYTYDSKSVHGFRTLDVYLLKYYHFSINICFPDNIITDRYYQDKKYK